MNKKISKLIQEYQIRIDEYDILIKREKQLRKAIRQCTVNGDIDEINYNIRRFNDLRQICVQIIVDLEDVFCNVKPTIPSKIYQ